MLLLSLSCLPGVARLSHHLQNVFDAVITAGCMIGLIVLFASPCVTDASYRSHDYGSDGTYSQYSRGMLLRSLIALRLLRMVRLLIRVPHIQVCATYAKVSCQAGALLIAI